MFEYRCHSAMSDASLSNVAATSSSGSSRNADALLPKMVNGPVLLFAQAVL